MNKQKPPAETRGAARGSPDMPHAGNAPACPAKPATGEVVKTEQQASSERTPSLERIKAMHTPVIGQFVYRHQLRYFAKDAEIDNTAVEYVADVLSRMIPRDPLEEMLVMQAIWTHARLGHLSVLANQQTATENLKTVHEAADRAANTFRKQLLALAEYRRPPRTDAFVAIKQANVAQQQVVANGQIPKSEKRDSSNELGSSAAKALPPHTGGAGFPAASGATAKAVAVEHRTQDASGQGPRQDERAKTR